MIDTSALSPYLTPVNQGIMNAVANTGPAFVNAPLPSLPSAGNLNDYYQKAFQALQPYYQAKLAEAQGDLDEAKRRITYDYQTGTRYNSQDTQLAQERQTQDFQSALQKLGGTFDTENKQQTDTLNKRGIALVQGPNGQATAASASPITYDAQGNPQYQGGQGQAGYERSMLAEDQRLRKEAEMRTTQRGLQDVGIKNQRTTEQLGETQGRGSYDAKRQFQQTGEQLGEQHQSQAYGVAGQMSSADSAQKQAQAAQDSARAYQEAVKQTV